MRVGDDVILLADPFKLGVGEITGTTRHGWLWVTWANGHHDSYDPQALEHASVWEDRTLRTAA